MQKYPWAFWFQDRLDIHIDMKSKKVKRFGRWVIACQVTDIEGNWQGWQPAGSGNLPVSRFSFISDYLVVLSLGYSLG